MCRVTCGRATYSAFTRASLTLIDSDICTFSCIWSMSKGPCLLEALKAQHNRSDTTANSVHNPPNLVASHCCCCQTILRFPGTCFHIFLLLLQFFVCLCVQVAFLFLLCQSLLFSFILCFYSRIGLMTCYDFSIVCQVYTSRWLWPWWWNRRSCFLKQLGEVVSKLKFDCSSGSCCQRVRALAWCSCSNSICWTNFCLRNSCS